MNPLTKHCETLDSLFVKAGVTLSRIRTDAEIVAACDAVLALPGLGATYHLVMMIRSAADGKTPLADRLALRAVLDGDEERAARIWRAELAGTPVAAQLPPES